MGSGSFAARLDARSSPSSVVLPPTGTKCFLPSISFFSCHLTRHSSANLGHATPSSRSPLMLPSNASGLTQAKSISCCRGPSKGARASDALLSGGKAVFSIGNQTAIPYQVGLSPSSSSSSCCPSSSSSSSSSSAAAAPFLFPSACAFLPRC